jgi:hypothetical protein
MTVLKNLEREMTYSIQGGGRCFDVRLTNIQVVNFYSFSFCSFCVRNQFAYRRGGHFLTALRYSGHIFLYISKIGRKNNVVAPKARWKSKNRATQFAK